LLTMMAWPFPNPPSGIVAKEKRLHITHPGSFTNSEC
jgi:hypothetical protein